ncbi:MAG: glycosyltransferase, partial [Gemmatimonadetes bacterium]|nr:glycosyltransferase [Gemmatimonadota bacterium]
MTDLLEGVTWFRGSSIRIRRGGLEVHVDPVGVDEGTADCILLTHPHFDNFSEEDVARVRTPETVVVAPASMKKQIEDADHLIRLFDVAWLASDFEGLSNFLMEAMARGLPVVVTDIPPNRELVV